MLPCKPGRLNIPAYSAAYSPHLVGNHRLSIAGTAEHNPLINPYADSEPVKTLAAQTGADAAQVPEILEGFTFLPMSEQTTDTWLGGAAKTVKGTADFLKGAGRIDSVKDDYSAFVNADFAKAAQ